MLSQVARSYLFIFLWLNNIHVSVYVCVCGHMTFLSIHLLMATWGGNHSIIQLSISLQWAYVLALSKCFLILGKSSLIIMFPVYFFDILNHANYFFPLR